ncbi:unnamed protein product, partial [Urochloa humidicola]
KKKKKTRGGKRRAEDTAPAASSPSIGPVGAMALRYLATTVSSRALRRAWGPAPSVRPAAGSRLLSSYRSSQSGAYPDMEEMLRRSDCLREERNRALKIVQERCFKEIELWNKEWADFEKVVR